MNKLTALAMLNLKMSLILILPSILVKIIDYLCKAIINLEVKICK